ncbi:MAG: hypothetical protein AAFU66_05045 [Pseudomonadota bacterium]
MKLGFKLHEARMVAKGGRSPQRTRFNDRGKLRIIKNANPDKRVLTNSE